MNKVPIIRKGIYKDYLNPAIREGWIVGLLYFLISLISQPVMSALLTGLLVWTGLIILFMGIGFPITEYYVRKKQIEKLKSKKYSFLHEESFQLHSDLFFEGTYRGYFVRILPMRKWQRTKKDVEYDIIEAYYTFDPENNEKKESRLTGKYYMGKLYFSNHCVAYIPDDWKNPDFKDNLDGLTGVLKREELKPFSKEEWENSFGKELKEQEKKEEKARTRQIIKIGKLIDIKYIKK
jgi:hypothetical protein